MFINPIQPLLALININDYIVGRHPNEGIHHYGSITTRMSQAPTTPTGVQECSVSAWMCRKRPPQGEWRVGHERMWDLKHRKYGYNMV